MCRKAAGTKNNNGEKRRKLETIVQQNRNGE